MIKWSNPSSGQRLTYSTWCPGVIHYGDNDEKRKRLTVEVKNVSIKMFGERDHVAVFVDGKLK
jgi:hypothetical protein